VVLGSGFADRDSPLRAPLPELLRVSGWGHQADPIQMARFPTPTLMAAS